MEFAPNGLLYVVDGYNATIAILNDNDQIIQGLDPHKACTMIIDTHSYTLDIQIDNHLENSLSEWFSPDLCGNIVTFPCWSNTFQGATNTYFTSYKNRRYSPQMRSHNHFYSGSSSELNDSQALRNINNEITAERAPSRSFPSELTRTAISIDSNGHVYVVGAGKGSNITDDDYEHMYKSIFRLIPSNSVTQHWNCFLYTTIPNRYVLNMTFDSSDNLYVLLIYLLIYIRLIMLLFINFLEKKINKLSHCFFFNAIGYLLYNFKKDSSPSQYYIDFSNNFINQRYYLIPHDVDQTLSKFEWTETGWENNIIKNLPTNFYPISNDQSIGDNLTDLPHIVIGNADSNQEARNGICLNYSPYFEMLVKDNILYILQTFNKGPDHPINGEAVIEANIEGKIIRVNLQDISDNIVGDTQVGSPVIRGQKTFHKNPITWNGSGFIFQTEPYYDREIS